MKAPSPPHRSDLADGVGNVCARKLSDHPVLGQKHLGRGRPEVRFRLRHPFHARGHVAGINAHGRAPPCRALGLGDAGIEGRRRDAGARVGPGDRRMDRRAVGGAEDMGVDLAGHADRRDCWGVPGPGDLVESLGQAAHPVGGVLFGKRAVAGGGIGSRVTVPFPPVSVVDDHLDRGSFRISIPIRNGASPMPGPPCRGRQPRRAHQRAPVARRRSDRADSRSWAAFRKCRYVRGLHATCKSIHISRRTAENVGRCCSCQLTPSLEHKALTPNAKTRLSTCG